MFYKKNKNLREIRFSITCSIRKFNVYSEIFYRVALILEMRVLYCTVTTELGHYKLESVGLFDGHL